MAQTISRISVYTAQVPIKEGTYTMSHGRALDHFDSTIARIDTKEGLTGWGEVVPLGSTYLPSYVAGARAGIKELAPHLIGRDATQLEAINRIMDTALKGHPYCKSPLDQACWDILGKEAGLPVHILLGGRFGEKVRLYRSITQEAPEAMVERIKGFKAQGYKQFQLKVGGEVDVDIERIIACAEAADPGDGVVSDANGGWLPHEAARVVRAARDLDIAIEQPCTEYEENLTIRRRCDHPFVLDENIQSMGALLRGIADGAMDAINIKLSKLGGLTRARAIRDVCVASGIAMTIEDTAATDIGVASIIALAHATPVELRFSATLSHVKLAHATAEGSPVVANGEAAASMAPGLGIEPLMDVLGEPLFAVS